MRKIRIPNPNHAPSRIGWDLKLDPPKRFNHLTGELEIFLHDRDPGRPLRKLAFPCLITASGKCFAQKIGVKREYDRETGELETETPLIVVELKKPLMLEVDRIIRMVEKECTQIISLLKKSISAFIVISPKERKIPAEIEMQEIPYSSLPEDTPCYQEHT